MTARPYRVEDYPEIISWCDARSMPAPPSAMLPDLGLVVAEDDELLAAGWCYMDKSSGVGFPHWFCTRPGLTLDRAREATGWLTYTIRERAKEKGMHTLVTTVHEEGIAREAVNSHGFQLIAIGGMTLYLQL